MSYIMRLLNRRGLQREQMQYGLNKGRVMGVRFTDADIRDAEIRGKTPILTYMFQLDENGRLVRITERTVQPDVLVYLTLSTFNHICKGRISPQDAYKLRLLQIRYMSDVAEQEEDMLHDVGLALKIMNDIRAEVLNDEVSTSA